MLLPGYDARKAAQVAAYFALRANGGINVLKLSKLLYLAEREFMARHDAPMFYDTLVSMPDGPVTSITLNLINGNVEHPEWAKFIASRTDYTIRLANDELQLRDLLDLLGRHGADLALVRLAGPLCDVRRALEQDGGRLGIGGHRRPLIWRRTRPSRIDTPADLFFWTDFSHLAHRSRALSRGAPNVGAHQRPPTSAAAVWCSACEVAARRG